MIPTQQELDREVDYRHSELVRLRREGLDIGRAMLALARRLDRVVNRLEELAAELATLAGGRDPNDGGGT